MKYKINSLYADTFSNFLLKIKKNFLQNDTTIHKARNELKIIHHNDIDVVIKSFKIPNLLRRVFYTYFRDSKAKKSYDYSVKIGAFTPESIGYIEFYKDKLLADSYFIAKKFEYDFTIKEPIVDRNFAHREEIFVALARFTYELHQNSILHKDYSPGNILIKKEEDTYLFKIVDINRMEFKELNLDERLKNFSKLWMLDDDISIIAKEYAKLSKEDEQTCIDLTLSYSRALKRKINMKKRLKGIEVVD
jgi:tRNA A-37 threonylcarbamoyl transferase component Bud32